MGLEFRLKWVLNRNLKVRASDSLSLSMRRAGGWRRSGRSRPGLQVPWCHRYSDYHADRAAHDLLQSLCQPRPGPASEQPGLSRSLSLSSGSSGLHRNVTEK